MESNLTSCSRFREAYLSRTLVDPSGCLRELYSATVGIIKPILINFFFEISHLHSMAASSFHMQGL